MRAWLWRTNDAASTTRDVSLAELLTLGCALALAGLLVGEATGRRPLVYIFKPLASVCFVGIALALGAAHRGTYQTLVLIGLVLAAGGDVALMLPTRSGFLVGLVLFLLGHLAYAGACATIAPPSRWLHPLAIAPIVASAFAFAWLSPHLGRLRPAVVAYVVAITVMVIGALAVERGGAHVGPATWLLPAGAIAFYASDVSVARDRFVRRSFLNRAWGLPAYYVGQVLLAWATG